MHYTNQIPHEADCLLIGLLNVRIYGIIRISAKVAKWHFVSHGGLVVNHMSVYTAMEWSDFFTFGCPYVISGVHNFLGIQEYYLG